MKSVMSAAIVFGIMLVSVPASASTLEADAMVLNTSVVNGEFAGAEKVVFQVGRITDFAGTSLFWVLGSGLIAVSLVGRRISS